ncbi:MAG: hypothetical protein EBS07_01420 [Sphingobacteriia bacterium]|nr:hypothetical protein [Sphingobacteriia bacterium]
MQPRLGFLLLALITLITGLWCWISFTDTHVFRKGDIYPTHQTLPYQDWRAFRWADPSGYYIYLPATFIYHWDGSLISENHIQGSGKGFEVEQKKIITKYTFGVALLELPAFAIAHLYSLITDQADGFSPPYILALQLNAIFWGCLGLGLVLLIVARRYGERIAVGLILLITLGSPLFYYQSAGGGMSHIYSFGLGALLAYLLDTDFKSHRNKILLIGLLISLLIFIRPTNFLLVLGIWIEFNRHIIIRKESKEIKFLALGIAAFSFLCWVPQLFYRHWLTGEFFNYPYEHESFSHLTDPAWIEFLFSPNNGLVIYSPLTGLGLLVGIVYCLRYPTLHRILRIGILIFSIYLFSSWHIWSFGCGFGSRNFVEYQLLFVGIWVEFLSSALRFSVWKKRGIALMFSTGITIGLYLMISHPRCYLGKGDWDWSEIRYRLGKHPSDYKLKTSEMFQLGEEYYSIAEDTIRLAPEKRFREVRMWVTYTLPPNPDIKWVLDIESENSKVYYHGEDMNSNSEIPYKFYHVFTLPDLLPAGSRWKIYAWNPDKHLWKGKASLDIQFN